MTAHIITAQSTACLTKVFVGGHPANLLDGDQSQQTGAHEGADPREEKEEPHDGTLHGLGGC